MDKKVKILAILFLLTCISFLTLRFSRAYFSDTEKTLGNSIQVGTWGTTITPTPTEIPPGAPTPTPTETIAPAPTETPIPTPTSTTAPTSTPTPTTAVTRVVINEVYYDVAPGKGDEGNSANPDEWVELYNNTDSPINLKDWSLSDNSGSTNISNANVYIPANGFAVLAKSASTWTYWTIPSTAEKISLGQKIGNGLANDGDRVILKDDQGVEVDAVSWGDDTYAFTPAATDVAEGHSLERDPDGKDTNSAGDFVDRTDPSPGS